MTLAPEEIRPGIVHYVSGEEILGSVGSRIASSRDGGFTWATVCNLPFSEPKRTLARSSLLRRYARAMTYHVVPAGESSLVAIGARRVFSVDRASGEIRSTTPLEGSHPLALCAVDGLVYYGVYDVAQGPKTSRVLCSADGGRSWTTVLSVPGVRHVHGIFHDPFEDAFWVTTGDSDEESWLLRCSRDFSRVERVLGGSQERRIVQPVFTDRAIYFGSDSPHLDNRIHRYDRGSGRVDDQVRVGSSVFFGANVDGEVFFGTAIEPSWRTHQRRVRLWHRGRDGWRSIWSGRRPPALSWLCYPRILFPAGSGDGAHVWWSALGTLHDQRVFRLPLDAVRHATRPQ